MSDIEVGMALLSMLVGMGIATIHYLISISAKLDNLSKKLDVF